MTTEAPEVKKIIMSLCGYEGGDDDSDDDLNSIITQTHTEWLCLFFMKRCCCSILLCWRCTTLVTVKESTSRINNVFINVGTNLFGNNFKEKKIQWRQKKNYEFFGTNLEPKITYMRTIEKRNATKCNVNDFEYKVEVVPFSSSSPTT